MKDPRTKEQLLQEIDTLRELLAEYENLVNEHSELIIILDRNGKFLFVNQFYCSIFGFTEDELLGQAFMPLIHEDDRNATLEAMQNLFNFPYKCYVEQRALTVDGWKCFAWADKAILDKNNQVSAILGVGREITKQKQKEIKSY